MNQAMKTTLILPIFHSNKKDRDSAIAKVSFNKKKSLHFNDDVVVLEFSINDPPDSICFPMK